MKSPVYFADLRAKPNVSLVDKVKGLLEAVDLSGRVKDRAFVAVKIHFGETGNTAYVQPVFVRKIVNVIKEAGGQPFLTDANTLYVGTRSDSVAHLKTAILNGFTYAVVDAPLIIADGLRGGNETTVKVDLKQFKRVYIGSEIVRADAIVIGMGCASRKGKLAQHSSVSPKVKRKKCEGCGDCVEYCAQKAISLFDEKAKIDRKKCVGCGECIIVCPNQAIQIQWDQDIPAFLENMVEYTAGVLKGKEDSALFLNFITQVSPACDCYPHNDAPIVPDIGIVASTDPVAIDQASADLVNNAEGLKNSCLTKNFKPGEDKFRAIYPNTDWEIQLEYAEEIGLGTRSYELIKI
ncbi:MAG: DUF362 domain-containing protein [Deltaproteobacteria bacterium]|nr:DUF362 domain-containing protein [Deltaproteobacteria bacterium]